MATSEVKMPVRDLVREITLDLSLEGASSAARRFKIGSWFFRLGARIIGCRVRINDDPVRTLQKAGHWAAADLLEKQRAEVDRG
jgi:hypothetical protein